VRSPLLPITPLESALPRNCVLRLLESTLPKKGGWGRGGVKKVIFSAEALRFLALALSLVIFLLPASAQSRRKVIIDQDCSGPGGSNMQTLLLLIQSPQVQVLGITVVSGNQWRDEEVAHTLRLLEIIGRTDIPVFPGAVFPFVRTPEEARLWQERYGKVGFAGAWDPRWWHEPFIIPDLPEGAPTTKSANEDATHFLIRMVHKYPHEVTIYEGGPMTNLAVATAIDPQFPELAQELVFMGGSLHPVTDNPEFSNTPRHEFNFWFDPEAADKVLHAAWKKITCTSVDISIKTRLTPEMIKEIAAAGTPLAQYVARFFQPGLGSDYMWDELAAAAWIDPTLITKRDTLYLAVDTEHCAAYGNTLSWSAKDQPKLPARQVEVLLDLDNERFNRMFVDLMRAPTPAAARKTD
jgi:inosine-uridine nucleoside N-ribohydrolase